MQREVHRISFSKLAQASIPTENANFKLIDRKVISNREDYWRVTGFTLVLMAKLLNSQGGYSSILGTNHREPSQPHDLLELFNPFLDKSIGLYCTKNGGVTFSLRDEFPEGRKKQRGHPKIETTGSKFGDAKLISNFLKQFSKEAQSDVQVDGPTDEESYVVMMAPQAATLGKIGENGEIIGVVFTPVKSKDNRTVHGKVQLLFRGKP